jgi:diguanylate cyclase (GGDEF)-like protein
VTSLGGPERGLERARKQGFERSTIIAFGGWAALSLLLLTGTLTTLGQAELTERAAVLDRADAGAAALEQTMLRVFAQVDVLQSLAQTRARMIAEGNTQGQRATEEELQNLAPPKSFGILRVSIVGPDGHSPWVSPPAADMAPLQPIVEPNGQLPDPPPKAPIKISAPQIDPTTKRWIVEVRRALWDRNGKTDGYAVATLDPLFLSDLIGSQDFSPGERSVVQLCQIKRDKADPIDETDMPCGTIIARSHNPVAAITEQVSPNDPVLLLARTIPGGKFRDRNGMTDRLVGFRAPADFPIVVSHTLDAQVALKDFFGLQRVVLAVMLALVVGAFLATRLVLSNFLLRERLSEQALQDPLTGLRNRRYFSDVLAKRMINATRQGDTALVLLIDLDGFKQVNDTRGHPVGDELLRQVATRLRGCADPTDIVMRFGGDEFAIVRIGRTQRRDATSLARYIVNELGEMYNVDDYMLRISVSVGVAMPPDGGEDLNDLLRRADIALYFVKAEGGNAYQLFDPAMESSVRSKRALELDLREAEARGELEVYFQPLVTLEPRRVSGFEALLRWHHPTLGMVMPSRFIPLAEETGLIASMGAWVLRQACHEAARWPGQTRVAVNLSPVQFERSDIIDIVTSALRDSHLEPSRLELEITEGVVMRDTADALRVMRQLQSLGVRLALDDFGTGYSSLSYLRSFPFDKVKVDGSFLADMHGDGGTIIRAVLGLCLHLGLDSLVEGVETEEQLDWLRVEGCTEVQGHVFSAPQPASRAPEIIGSVAGRAPRMADQVTLID